MAASGWTIKVTGSAGLSITADRHEIMLGSRRFWTWCAYDILGIFGALEAAGWARSRSPATCAMIELDFVAGKPGPTHAVLFRPDPSRFACCANVHDEWCPNSNLFEDETAARSWSERLGLEAQILALPDASQLAALRWQPLVRSLELPPMPVGWQRPRFLDSTARAPLRSHKVLGLEEDSDRTADPGVPSGPRKSSLLVRTWPTRQR